MSGSYDDEIKVALTANAAQLEEGVAEATASIKGMQQTVAQEAAAFNAAVQSKVDAMVRLNAAFSGNVATSAGMAEAELALDEAMAAGAVTAAEYAGYVAQLDAAEVAMTATATAATAAMTEQAAALTLTGGVAREVGVMIGEVVRGNYTRLEGSTVTLMNRSGYLSTALNALLSPLGLVAIGVAALGYEIFEAGQRFEEMEGTVLATGDASGYTAGQLVQMADQIGAHTGSINEATQAVQKLAESGRFAGEDLRLVAVAASDMAALTGESIQSCVSQIVRLQEDPVKAVAKLNDQFHFLTVAQFQEIEAAQQAGDSMKAASIAYEAMADKMEGRTDQLNQHVNVLIQSWRNLKQVWSSSLESADTMLGGGDTAQKLADAQRILKNYQDQNSALLSVHSHSAGLTAQIQAQVQEVQRLTDQLNQEKAAAASVGAAAQQTAAQIDGMAKSFKGGGGSAARDLESDLRREEAEQKISYDKREEFEATYWQKILDTSKEGTQEYITAWQHVQSAQQQLDRQQEESWTRAQRQRAEAARQATREVMQSFELERAEAVQGSQQRIAIDASMMDRIKQMEGENSADFKRALTQRLADTKAFVDQAIAEQKRAQAENDKEYKSNAEIATKSINEVFTQQAKDVQEKYRLHQMSSNQEIALLRQNADEQFQVDMDILEHYKSLVGDKPDVVRKINQQIEDLQTQHNARLSDINRTAAQQETELWKSRLQPITSAFNQSIAGMIQGTQTLQQGVARILQSIMLSYLQTILQAKEEWLAGELAKLTMTTQTATSTTAVLATQRAANDAADRASSVASVTRATGVAGAQGLASFAAAPWPIDMGAPAFGASMSAAAAGYIPIASASGGWDRVPADDAPALLHRNEMVLPASLADRVRGMTDTGGQGGGDTHNHHYHFQTPDARSFDQWLRKGGGAALERYAAGKGKNSPLTRS